MREQALQVLARLNARYLRRDQIVGQLKVSEKQIVEIGKALLNQSKLLIMDEPTSALNQTEVEALFGIVDLLKAQGVTILYVSHRLEEIFRLADAVTVLRDGAHISTRSIERGDARVADRGHDRAQAGRCLPGAKPSAQGEEMLRVEGLCARGVLRRRELQPASRRSAGGGGLIRQRQDGTRSRAVRRSAPQRRGSVMLKGEAVQAAAGARAQSRG